MPPVFHDLFVPVKKIHSYNTRLASKESYSLPKTRTNFGTPLVKMIKNCQFLN